MEDSSAGIRAITAIVMIGIWMAGSAAVVWWVVTVAKWAWA